MFVTDAVAPPTIELAPDAVEPDALLAPPAIVVADEDARPCTPPIAGWNVVAKVEPVPPDAGLLLLDASVKAADEAPPTPNAFPGSVCCNVGSSPYPRTPWHAPRGISNVAASARFRPNLFMVRLRDSRWFSFEK
jgi:hypothetical protein